MRVQNRGSATVRAQDHRSAPRVEAMSSDLVTRLLPILAQPLRESDFNIFDVLHHGTHEKQLSNLFAWLLNPQGTHRLGDAFQRIFIDEVNRALPLEPTISSGTYSVRQEVNTSPPGEGMDIADLVLETEDAVLVVENYYTSDGHGHCFEGYRKFGAKAGKTSTVVMLCGSRSSADLSDGWDGAAVVTHATLVDRLVRHVMADEGFQQANPQQQSFFDHMDRHFVKGRRVNDNDLIGFIDAICASGEAEHYGGQKREDAAINFADTLREQALERFGESVELLRRVKASLFNYSREDLKDQLDAALGGGVIGTVFKNYKGNYEWTVAIYRVDDPESWLVQLKFGPSAWYANERDGHWERTVPAAEADYSRLFLTHGKEIRQSEVSLREVLDGLAAEDFRLRDELLPLIDGTKLKPQGSSVTAT